ncbi:DUF3488 and transglutaminase-like domain-containing protein [Microbacterium soli]|uniref:DUF3488 and transglutaminase-like domain-containing protein n=1 Tax=Microbacterium soli TaxID=446075 RepID=A0ABP7NAJ0_9MICO
MAEPSPSPDRVRIGAVGPGLLTAFAAFVALWPYTGVVLPGPWTFSCSAIIIVVVVAGMLARAALASVRSGIRHPLVLLVQATAAVLVCTAVLVGDTARFGMVPTGASLRLMGLLLVQSVDEILTGVAPVAATLAMAALLGLVFAAATILIDQLIVHRLVILAVLLTSLLGAMPMLVSFGAVDIAWFLLQSVTILLLLRFGARHDPRAPRSASFPSAILVGALAVVTALMVAPAAPLASALSGTGPMLTVSADLRLGDDLRRPEGIEALTLVTSASSAPYLRMATLSSFDGEVWRPDRADRVPLSEGFGERDWSEEITTVETEVSIRVTGVSSDRLPLPYAPERVIDADPGWSAMPANRTATSLTADAAGADYTVEAATAKPTLEQIRASSASGVRVPDLPEGLSPIIGELATEVTADADTDYDRLVALQDWFRTEFDYSLDAPVEEGFDGTGADAVATFLQARTGYCIHFAGAFALMASTLDMPVRIVVGYLPGTPTDQLRDDGRVYSVSSDQLHSWPEVHFAGIGWVPFEPTATLGVPTAFAAASADADGGGGDAPEASADPSTGPSTAPTRSDGLEEEPSAGESTPLQRLDPTPVMLTALGVLLVLALPALVRELRRAVRRGRAHSGDAMAAWRELTDTLVDLGLAVPEAQTARVRADVLATSRGVDTAALERLVRAVEHRSYARTAPDAGDLSAPLQIVIAQLGASVDARQRLRARLLPASLFNRRR